MSNYVLGVVSHSDREVQRVRLSGQVKPDVIMVDDGSRGPGGNHFDTIAAARRMAVTSGAEWVVVLEDDAVPVTEFNHQLSMALDVAPSSVVSLYSGTGYPAQYQRMFDRASTWPECWILHAHMRHAVGYALRADVFEAGLMLQLGVLTRKGWAPDDMISEWCKSHALSVAYTNPSLVDHEDGPQVIRRRTHRGRVTGPRRRPRHAHRFGQRLTWDGSHARV